MVIKTKCQVDFCKDTQQEWWSSAAKVLELQLTNYTETELLFVLQNRKSPHCSPHAGPNFLQTVGNNKDAFCWLKFPNQIALKELLWAKNKIKNHMHWIILFQPHAIDTKQGRISKSISVELIEEYCDFRKYKDELIGQRLEKKRRF